MRRKLKDPMIPIGEIGAVRFRGRMWYLGVADLKKERLRGICLVPKRNGMKCGAILVSEHLPIAGPMVTEAIIHETLHVAFPRAKEKQVEQAASLVAKVLRAFEKAKRTEARP